MTSNLRLDATDPHTYGLNAAAAQNQFIDDLFKASIPDAIQMIKHIKDETARDRYMQALIHFHTFADHEAAAQMIKGYEYLAAHLHLGKHMHALRVIDQMDQVSDYPFDYPSNPIDESPPYPVPDKNYQPAATCITETLTESIQASNAPSAAISAAS